MRVPGLPTIFALAASSILATSGSAQIAPATDSTAKAAAATRPLMRWQGMLRETLTNSVMGTRSSRQKTTGNVVLTELAPDRMRVQLTLSTRMNEAGSLQWAVLPGGCGGNAMPIVGFERFPVIQVGPNGRAEMDLEIALAIPQNGQHHVNVYAGGTRFDNVLTCGALRARK